MKNNVFTVERLINAPPEVIFDQGLGHLSAAGDLGFSAGGRQHRDAVLGVVRV